MVKVSHLFDEYSLNYEDVIKKSIGFMGQTHDYYTKIKAAYLLANLRRLYGNTRTLRVLDVGCGTGKTDSFLISDLGTLSGVDVSSACIEVARRENSQVTYEVYDGHTLPFEDDSFDAVFLICVMHHVPPDERLALLCEVRRVVRAGGAVFIFEHNPAHPLTRLVVARCEFDRDARLLSMRCSKNIVQTAGWSLAEAQYILYVPFEMKYLRGVDCLRRTIPFGAQYFVAGINRPEWIGLVKLD